MKIKNLTPEIMSLEQLSLETGDTIIVHLDRVIDGEMVSRARDQVFSLLPDNCPPDISVIVLDAGTTLSVVSEREMELQGFVSLSRVKEIPGKPSKI